ncbi:uncharacterized protein LOC128681215 [Plodia interpunctella]|uniref:uncharacterized protein LOC128681215 n=1 Tax=Plodia interpunctella TaxID=58824 RepID=UPI002367E282|nr:uncharacterized protein LOC128681215 [Plodia interpunctella]
MEQAITVILTTLFYTQTNALVTRETLLKSGKLQFECTELLVLNGVYAFKEKNAILNGIPADIRIHWKTDSIYFTLVSSEMKMSLQTLRSSGDIETIKVAGLGQTSTVDNLNDIVYLGTDNGVYKYKEDGSVEHYTALGEDVMYIAVNNDGSAMYIATWPQNRVYKINNDSQSLERFMYITNGHGLTIDTRNNMFFVDVATETLYVLKNGEHVPAKLKGLRDDKMINVFVSRSDVVYAMDDNSNLYVIDIENEVARYLRTFNISGVNTFGLDSSDNVFIGCKGVIYKFYMYEKNPCNVIGTTHSRLNPGPKHQRRRRQKKDRKTTTTTTTTTEIYEDDDDEDDDDEEDE